MNGRRRKDDDEVAAMRVPASMAVTTIVLAMAGGACGGRAQRRAGDGATNLASPTVTGVAAPPSVQAALAAVADRGLPDWLSPQIEASQAREAAEVETGRGRAVVWYAPDARDGWCLGLQSTWEPAAVTSVDTASGVPLPADVQAQLRHDGQTLAVAGDPDVNVACTGSAGAPTAAVEVTYQGGQPDGSGGRAPFLIWGHADAPAVDADLVSADGTRTRLAVNEGFFVDALPPDRFTDGGRPATLVALDAAGVEVAREAAVPETAWQYVVTPPTPGDVPTPRSNPCPSPQAAADPSEPANPGSFLITFSSAGCDAAGEPLAPPSATVDALGGVGVVTGVVDRSATAARLVMTDGGMIELSLAHHQFVQELGASRLDAAHRPLRVEALAANGAVVAHVPVEPGWHTFISDER